MFFISHLHLPAAAKFPSSDVITHLSLFTLRVCDNKSWCRYDLNEWLGCKLQMNLAPEAGVSQGMVDVDLKVITQPAYSDSLYR